MRETIKNYIKDFENNKDQILEEAKEADAKAAARLLGKIQTVRFYYPNCGDDVIDAAVEICLMKMGYDKEGELFEFLTLNLLGEFLNKPGCVREKYFKDVLDGCYDTLDIFYDRDNWCRANAVNILGIKYADFHNGKFTEGLYDLFDLEQYKPQEES